MANDKKSFLLYCDIIHTIEKLSDEQAGRLFKHILMYVNDRNPVLDDIITQIAFEPIRQNLKRDLKKYEGIREKNRENAKKRWNATASDRMRMDAKNADNDNDNDNDINIYRKFNHLSITQAEFQKLNIDYKKADIDEILDDIENYKNNKQYKSLYLTAKNWLKRNKGSEASVPFEKLEKHIQNAIKHGYIKDERYKEYYGKH